METQTWVFDLDNTLYPAQTNLFAQVDIKMRDFIAEYLDVDPEQARVIQKKYFHENGTTLKGLMTHHDMDPKPFLDFVHDIDISMIDRSHELSDILGRLAGPKFIFTNASSDHAERIMQKLGVSCHFDGIFDIQDAGFDPKPNGHIYDLFLKRFDIDPSTAVMFEDMARNLKPAYERGMTCVWVDTDNDWGRPTESDSYIHHQTRDLVSWLKEVGVRLGSHS